MQKMCEPPDGGTRCPLEGLPLFHIALVASCSESVRDAGEVLVVVFDVQGGDDAVGVRFQVGGQLRVVFRGDDLDGDGDGGDFLLG